MISAFRVDVSWDSEPTVGIASLELVETGVEIRLVIVPRVGSKGPPNLRVA